MASSLFKITHNKSIWSVGGGAHVVETTYSFRQCNGVIISEIIFDFYCSSKIQNICSIIDETL